MKKEYNLKLDLNDVIKNISNKEKMHIIPIFIPHLGCNNDCVFCNQRKISGTKIAKDIQIVQKEIEESLLTINDSFPVQIAFFGGSFTGLEIDLQIKYLTLANTYINSNKVESIRISTRPDYINDDILKILKEYNVKTIELGVQSMDEDVLLSSKRGHTSQDVITSANLINEYKFELGFQIMIGLPKSNIDKEVETINKLKKYNAKYLRIYPVYVLEESKLYDMYLDNDYTPLTIEDAAFRTSKVINECLDTDIKIIRIGLQSTDEISYTNTCIKGPVCDNFAEFAISKLVLEKLENKILSIKDIDVKKDNINNRLNLNIITNNKYFSLVSGPKKINKNYLEDKYNLKIKLIGE